MPACGKSALAKEIADKNGIAYFDTDDLIEKKYHLKIADIFNKKGEKEFRKYEKTVLEELLFKDNYVAATGGGLPCFYDNMKKMNDTGITVYLKTPVEILLKRILKSSERPLTNGKDESELRKYLEKTLQEREFYYSEAKYIIDNDTDSEKLKSLQLFDN